MDSSAKALTASLTATIHCTNERSTPHTLRIGARITVFSPEAVPTVAAQMVVRIAKERIVIRVLCRRM